LASVPSIVLQYRRLRFGAIAFRAADDLPSSAAITDDTILLGKNISGKRLREIIDPAFAKSMQ